MLPRTLLVPSSRLTHLVLIFPHASRMHTRRRFMYSSCTLWTPTVVVCSRRRRPRPLICRQLRSPSSHPPHFRPHTSFHYHLPTCPFPPWHLAEKYSGNRTRVELRQDRARSRRNPTWHSWLRTPAGRQDDMRRSVSNNPFCPPLFPFSSHPSLSLPCAASERREAERR